jgi:hypothetical protein
MLKACHATAFDPRAISVRPSTSLANDLRSSQGVTVSFLVPTLRGNGTA